MTRSSDLVMVEREVRDLARVICKSRTCRGFSCCRWPAQMGERHRCPVDRGNYDEAAKDVLSYFAALQSVEGGVQVAAKQESCPEGAPRTETAIVAALRECQRVLAMMIDPASIKSTSVIHAFAAATEAEAKARTVLNGVAKSDGGAT